jgi:UDP-GlcNAc:undecaprenyl-phosphate GlcNAc-1-phosphate transferase
MLYLIYVKSIFAFVISFLITFYLVPICIKIAHTLQFLDQPDGAIKVHKQATPYMGGVAVYIGFLVAFCVTMPLENSMILFFAGSTLLLFIGLIDDFVVLKPYQKFFGQILAMICFMKAGLYLKPQFFLSTPWHFPVSALWMLTVMNAYNLVDVMDGLATTLALSATTSFLVIACYTENVSVAILLCCFAGPLLAFLWYNKPQAKIYLGDAGSLFIGGFLATAPFLLSWGIHSPCGYLAPVIILAIPLLELAALIIIRTYKKIPFYLGSPDHFSIYLQKRGWKREAILAYVAILSLPLFIVAFLLFNNVLFAWQVLAVGCVFLFFWIITIFYPNFFKVLR